MAALSCLSISIRFTFRVQYIKEDFAMPDFLGAEAVLSGYPDMVCISVR